MKGCELCRKPARMYCESDQASLCWECDNKVHSANFLVAKHCRTLLCRTCQSPTPWKASGSNLGPTVSVCDSCFSSHCDDNNSRNVQEEQQQESQSEEEMFEDEEQYDDDDDEEEEEVEEEDGENQVVPWSEMGSSVPCGMSGESSDEEASSGFSKRVGLDNPHLDSDEEIGSSSSQQGYGRYMSNEEGTSFSSHNNNNNRLKRARTSRDGNEEDNHGEKGSKSISSPTVIIDSLKRLHRDMVSDEHRASSTILGICKLSRDQSL